VTKTQENLLLEAERSTEAAELLSSQGFYGYAVSRAYYAMFYVAEAMLLEHNLSFSRHKAVIAAFGQRFARTGDVPPEFHRHLMEAMELRHTGDYGSGEDITAEQCQEQLCRAKAFLSLARDRLGGS
jgi:uncharacterized protein (UPF0332 family)